MLTRSDRSHEFTEAALDDALAASALSGVDRRLAQELTYGVVRWQGTLDWLIERKTRGREQKPMIQTLLRLGLYQLFWLDRIPQHAAVNESVALARELGYGPQSGFVNALLRGYTRELVETRRLLEELPRTDPAAGLSHPQWLCARWSARWSAEDLLALLRSNNSPAPVFARANTLRLDPGALLTQWREKEKVAYDLPRWDWVPENLMFELKSPPSLAALGSFQQGAFYVQDPSTVLAVQELDPQPGQAVLDLCAAPGGKTTLIAQQMRNDGRVIACDNDPTRLRQLRENCARLTATCVEPLLIEELQRRVMPRFDRILVDAPCSNTGVIRRRVDLRWRVRAEEIQRLAAVQLELLHSVAPRLQPGGVLVYSTCSLEPEENSGVTSAFLGGHPEFTLERERELFPPRDRADGAYVARLRKV